MHDALILEAALFRNHSPEGPLILLFRPTPLPSEGNNLVHLFCHVSTDRRTVTTKVDQTSWMQGCIRWQVLPQQSGFPEKVHLLRGGWNTICGSKLKILSRLCLIFMATVRST